MRYCGNGAWRNLSSTGYWPEDEASTAVDPNELNAVAVDLQKQSGVRHATWEVSTRD